MECTQKHYLQSAHSTLLSYKIMLFYFLNKSCSEDGCELNYFHTVEPLTICPGATA